MAVVTIRLDMLSIPTDEEKDFIAQAVKHLAWRLQERTARLHPTVRVVIEYELLTVRG